MDPFVTTGAVAFASDAEREQALVELEGKLGGLRSLVGPALVRRPASVVRWAAAGPVAPSLFEPGLAALGDTLSRAACGSALWAVRAPAGELDRRTGEPLAAPAWWTELRMADAETTALEVVDESERGRVRDGLRETRLLLGVERPDERLAAALWEGRRGWLRLREELSCEQIVASVEALDARRALGESFGLRRLDAASLDELVACAGDRALLFCTFVDAPTRVDARRRVLELLARRAPAAQAADELTAFAALDPAVSARATRLLTTLPPALVAERCAPFLERQPGRYRGAREALEAILVRVAGVLAALPPTPEVQALARAALRRRVKDPAYAAALGRCLEATQPPR